MDSTVFLQKGWSTQDGVISAILPEITRLDINGVQTEIAINQKAIASTFAVGDHVRISIPKNRRPASMLNVTSGNTVRLTEHPAFAFMGLFTCMMCSLVPALNFIAGPLLLCAWISMSTRRLYAWTKTGVILIALASYLGAYVLHPQKMELVFVQQLITIVITTIILIFLCARAELALDKFLTESHNA